MLSIVLIPFMYTSVILYIKCYSRNYKLARMRQNEIGLEPVLVQFWLMAAFVIFDLCNTHALLRRNWLGLSPFLFPFWLIMASLLFYVVFGFMSTLNSFNAVFM